MVGQVHPMRGPLGHPGAPAAARVALGHSQARARATEPAV